MVRGSRLEIDCRPLSALETLFEVLQNRGDAQWEYSEMPFPKCSVAVVQTSWPIEIEV